jgi:hypothetical protein
MFTETVSHFSHGKHSQVTFVGLEYMRVFCFHILDNGLIALGSILPLVRGVGAVQLACE